MKNVGVDCMNLDENKLNYFNDLLLDGIFNIKSELYKKNIKRDVITKLLDQIKKEWINIYNPVDITIKKSKRKVYSQYIKAKKEGDFKKAEELLKLYLELKNFNQP